MSRPPRFLPDHCLAAITARTLEGRYRLRPDSKTNEIIIGAIAKASKIFAVEVHAVHALSSHYHLLCSPGNAKALADFMQMIQRKIAYELNRLHKRRGPLWEQRYHLVPVTVEESAQVAQLKYVLSQGCKEGLVASPLDWPGVQSARALIEGEALAGKWLDRVGLNRARNRKGGESVRESDYEAVYQLELTKIPAWRSLDDATYRQRVAELVESIEQETAAMHRREGTQPVGPRRVRSQNPFTRPKNLALSPRPLVHAASKRHREAFRRQYREFCTAFREAAVRLARGERLVVFPVGSFPPGLPFVDG